MDVVSLEDFSDPEMVYQIGIAPNRIDIMMGVPGVDFPSAWRRRNVVQYSDLPMPIISGEDLILSNLAIGRVQILLDAKN